MALFFQRYFFFGCNFFYGTWVLRLLLFLLQRLVVCTNLLWAFGTKFGFWFKFLNLISNNSKTISKMHSDGQKRCVAWNRVNVVQKFPIAGGVWVQSYCHNPSKISFVSSFLPMQQQPIPILSILADISIVWLLFSRKSFQLSMFSYLLFLFFCEQTFQRTTTFLLDFSFVRKLLILILITFPLCLAFFHPHCNCLLR